MAEITLPITNMRFDVTMPLFEGRVEIEGATLEAMQTTPMVVADVPDLRLGDFGIWDLNMGYLLTAIEAGWEFAALPVFQKRKSVLQFLFVRDGIDSPRDLEGARVGTRQYRTSVTIWARGILAEHFGVDISGIKWAAAIDEFSPTRTPPAASKRSTPKPRLRTC
jgi:4,5-dihydroxyphthalate decarboxylase